MAGFTTQIKARFKALYPNVNLTAKRLDAIIARVDAKTDAEETIDASLEAINEFTPFADMARDDDRLRDLETKVKGIKPTDPANPDPNPDPTPEPKPGDEPPAWFKQFAETVNGKLTAIEGEKTITTRRTQLEAKLKDAPESYRNRELKAFDRMKFDTDEAYTEYLTEAEADYAAFVQEQSDAGLGGDAPKRGFGKVVGKEATEAESEEVFKNLKV